MYISPKAAKQSLLQPPTSLTLLRRLQSSTIRHMKTRTALFGTLLLTLLSACDSGVKWKDAPYEVVWIDTNENRTLNYNLGEGDSVGRVEAEVVAVGSDNKYVVAEQLNPATK